MTEAESPSDDGQVSRFISWLTNRRSNLGLMIATAAATLAIAATTFLGGYLWNRAHLAFVLLDTDNPPLVAEFIGDGGERLVPPETVPMQRAIEAPAGRHNLRLSGPGWLSQEMTLSLARGERFDAKLNLDSQSLWRSLEHGDTCRLFSFRRHGDVAVDVLLLNDQGLDCRDGGTSDSRWTLALKAPASPLLAEDVQIIWPRSQIGGVVSYARGVDAYEGRPWVVSQFDPPTSPSDEKHFEESSWSAKSTFDLNGDDASDLLLAARHQAWLMAISGENGEPLWVVARGSAGGGRQTRRRHYGIDGALAYSPSVVEDQDGDDVCDVLAMFVDASEKESHRRWIELLSGASGAAIWRYDLPESWFALSAGQEAPYHLRWFYGSGGGTGSSSSGGSGRYDVRGPRKTQRHGSHVYLPTQPHRMRLSQAGKVAFVAGKHFVALDLQTGKPFVEPQPIDVRTHLAPRRADLDGDQQIDLLLTEELPDRKAPNTSGTPQVRLSAFSPALKRVVWRRIVDARFPLQADEQLPKSDWPVVADLNGDGAAEVIVPHAGAKSTPSWNSPPSGEIQVLDGATGEPRWQRSLRSLDEQLDHFIVGPDIDDDGWQEVYVASLWTFDHLLFVDCLSGRDGHSLWRSQQPLKRRDNDRSDLRFAGLTWRVWGGDGWPQLIVLLRDEVDRAPGRACFLSSGTGKVTHVASGIHEIDVADLDGDRVDDLVLQSRSLTARELHACRGFAREPWREVTDARTVVCDLDGDNVRDLIKTDSFGALTAFSGATNVVLWRRESDDRPLRWSCHAAVEHDTENELLPRGVDLDGDQTPDLLLALDTDYNRQDKPLVTAVSGRTGQTLWESEAECWNAEAPALITCSDLDGDAQGEIIVATANDYDMPGASSNGYRLWLLVMSGRDGRLKWRQMLAAEGAYDYDRMSLAIGKTDLNNDGVLDLVTPAQQSDGQQAEELRALSGVGGELLWRRDLPASRDHKEALHNIAPLAIDDLNGDGKREVVTLALDESRDERGNRIDVLQAAALDARDGAVRWRWQTPCYDHFFNVGRDPSRAWGRIRPVLLRRSDGKKWVAFRTQHHRPRLHVLNQAGAVVGEVDSSNRYGRHARLWACDADGDGSDELALLHDEALALLRPDRLDEPVWRLPVRSSPVARVTGVLPDAPGGPQLTLQGGFGTDGDMSLRGIHAATGRVVWTCPAPIHRVSGAEILNADVQSPLLSGPDENQPPLARYHFGRVSLCRQAAIFQHAPASISRAAPTLQPAGHDPRMVRPLPWKPHDHDFGRMPWQVSWGMFYGVTLAAIPISFFAWIVRRRRFGLKSLLLLPVVAGVFMLGISTESRASDFNTTIEKLLVAYFFVGPILFSLWLFSRWIWRRSWRPALAWLVAGAMVTAGIVAVALWVVGPLEGRALLPGERWSMEGAYWILIPAYFAMAWGMTLLVPAAWLVKNVWRRRSERDQ